MGINSPFLGVPFSKMVIFGRCIGYFARARKKCLVFLIFWKFFQKIKNPGFLFFEKIFSKNKTEIFEHRAFLGGISLQNGGSSVRKFPKIEQKFRFLALSEKGLSFCGSKGAISGTWKSSGQKLSKIDNFWPGNFQKFSFLKIFSEISEIWRNLLISPRGSAQNFWDTFLRG